MSFGGTHTLSTYHPPTYFLAQCFSKFKVYMNHLAVLINYKMQRNRSWVGPRFLASSQVLLWRQTATLLVEVLIHAEASTALSALTPRSQEAARRKKSEHPLMRRGWQDHMCPVLETLTASSPTFGGLMWSNNCDFPLALVVKTEGQGT